MHHQIMTCCCVLITILVVSSASAEPIEQDRRQLAFTSIADEVVDAFLAETEAERKTLSGISISKDEEKEVGEVQMQDFLSTLARQRIRVTQRGEDADYLTSLVNMIHPLMRNVERYSSIHVHVAKTTETDARAFPGGFVVCSTGLINFAESEAALVGVLAHELSHIDRGHQLRMVRSIKLAESTFTTGNLDVEQFVQSGSLLAKQFARPFRPEEELEADLDAAGWMVELGYDPMEFAELFRRLHVRDGGDIMQMPSFLRTHPYHAKRYEVVKKLSLLLSEEKPNEVLYVGRENLRRRISRQVRQFPE